MDEMKLKLSTKFMRGVVAKLIAKAIYKKTGCKIDIRLNDLEISMINGQTSISTNVEVKLDGDEFMKLMNDISSKD